MRKKRQDRPPQIHCPVPDPALPEAARMWWRHFGYGWRRVPPAMRVSHGIVALDADGRVAGIIGLRDADGGFPAETPLLARLAFRAGPETADMVVDGIVVRDSRQGVGRALIGAALARAAGAGYPGLRAEVRVRSRTALAFYRALGFSEVARGRFGWPWTGQVLILRRACPPAD